MAVTPAGELSLPVLYLRNTVAGSATFQSVVGAASEAAALPSVVSFEAGESDPDTLAIVRHLNETDLSRRATTVIEGTGVLLLTFEFEVPQALIDDSTIENIHDEYAWFTNQVGAILAEMKTLSDTADEDDGYLAFIGLEMGPLGKADPKENNEKSIWVSEWMVAHDARL